MNRVCCGCHSDVVFSWVKMIATRFWIFQLEHSMCDVNTDIQVVVFVRLLFVMFVEH